MTEIQAVIFDLDDTLLKTAQIKWAHHKAVAAHYGVDLTDEDLARYWGMPFEVMIGHLYHHADTTENMLAANRALEAQFPKAIQEDTLNVLGTLARHGLVTGVVTSLTTDYARKDLALAGVPSEAFLFVQGADVTAYHKPDGRVFEPALAHLGAMAIRRSQVLYVGDALMDYQAATSASLQFVGVATGLVTLEQFKEAGAPALGRLGELPAYLGLAT
jgi:phosphoglycolate phosphatase-like HAD superfamily hydrolase